MIWHAVYCNHFVTMILNDSGNVFVQFLFPWRLNKRSAEFHRQYALNMDLGIGVRHGMRFRISYNLFLTYARTASFYYVLPAFGSIGAAQIIPGDDPVGIECR